MYCLVCHFRSDFQLPWIVYSILFGSIKLFLALFLSLEKLLFLKFFNLFLSLPDHPQLIFIRRIFWWSRKIWSIRRWWFHRFSWYSAVIFNWRKVRACFSKINGIAYLLVLLILLCQLYLLQILQFFLTSNFMLFQ